MKIGPCMQRGVAVLEDRGYSLLKYLDEQISQLIAMAWDVPANDISCSAENLFYARGEADLQVEIRYTAGTDEYGRGVPFDPTEEDRATLAEKIKDSVRIKIFSTEFTLSVWIVPHYKSAFIGPK
jgi:hypothetical protein